MTKTDAIIAINAGYKLTHKHFTSEEWIRQFGLMYEFEDGCQCSHEEFWLYRDDDSWQKDWKIYQKTI